MYEVSEEGIKIASSVIPEVICQEEAASDRARMLLLSSQNVEFLDIKEWLELGWKKFVVVCCIGDCFFITVKP
eukprot:13008227-Ditylum_brightwellii.AAC.1